MKPRRKSSSGGTTSTCCEDDDLSAVDVVLLVKEEQQEENDSKEVLLVLLVRPNDQLRENFCCFLLGKQFDAVVVLTQDDVMVGRSKIERERWKNRGGAGLLLVVRFSSCCLVLG